jgi:hypothetical protein
VSWRSKYKAGVALAGAVVAISMAGPAAVVISVAAAGGTPAGGTAAGGTAAGGTAQVADASVAAGDSTTAVTYQVSGPEQSGTLAHWTSRRMRAATALSPVLPRSGLPATAQPPTRPTQSQLLPEVTVPKGIPRAVPFTGSPTTGALFYTTGGKKFYCHGFWTGTSGGPWISGYKAKNGTGTVFGVIGGYELGGDYDWASYSAYFGSATRVLYTQVEAQTAPHPKPTPTPAGTPTKSTAAATTTSASAAASPASATRSPSTVTAAPSPRPTTSLATASATATSATSSALALA